MEAAHGAGKAMTFVAIMSTLAVLLGAAPCMLCGDHELERVARNLFWCVTSINVVIASVAWTLHG